MKPQKDKTFSSEPKRVTMSFDCEIPKETGEPFFSLEERDALYAMMYHVRAQRGSAISPTPAMYKAASNVKLEWLPQQLELTF